MWKKQVSQWVLDKNLTKKFKIVRYSSNSINFLIIDFTVFEEPEDPTNRSFFSEIISSISDVKFSNSGRYMISRDYLSVKVWDLHMETKPIETYTVHEYLRSKLCSLYENDCIFDKFECCWNGNDTAIMTGSYNNFFRMFDRSSRKEVTYEASKEIAKPKTILKPRKVRKTLLKFVKMFGNLVIRWFDEFLGGKTSQFFSDFFPLDKFWWFF